MKTMHRESHWFEGQDHSVMTEKFCERGSC